MTGKGLAACGDEVAAKMEEARKAGRLKRLKVTPTIQNEIIDLMKRQLSAKPEEPQTKYIAESFGRPAAYDIMLVQTQPELEIREYKYGPGFRVKWRGEFMTAFFQKGDIVESEGKPFAFGAELVPDTYYVLVGKYKISASNNPQYKGRSFNNFNTHHIITMEQVEAFDESEMQQDKEIAEKVSEHKQPATDEGELESPETVDVTPEPTE